MNGFAGAEAGALVGKSVQAGATFGGCAWGDGADVWARAAEAIGSAQTIAQANNS